MIEFMILWDYDEEYRDNSFENYIKILEKF